MAITALAFVVFICFISSSYAEHSNVVECKCICDDPNTTASYPRTFAPNSGITCLSYNGGICVEGEEEWVLTGCKDYVHTSLSSTRDETQVSAY